MVHIQYTGFLLGHDIRPQLCGFRRILDDVALLRNQNQGRIGSWFYLHLLSAQKALRSLGAHAPNSRVPTHKVKNGMSSRNEDGKTRLACLWGMFP